MITTVDSQVWDAADLTGNSAIAVLGGITYLVGGRRGDGTQALYRSLDGGKTWAVAATIPAAQGSTDPVMAPDELGNLHIVVAHPTPGQSPCMDVLKFTYATGSGVLSPAVVLLQASKSQASYDVVSLGSGASLVVTAAMEPMGRPGRYVLMAFEIAVDQTVVPTAIIDQPWDSGDTYGGLSLVAPGGSAPVELYLNHHPRTFTYRDTETVLARMLRVGPGVWGDPTPLTSFVSRFTDDKLTVVPTVSGRRLIATAFHQQVLGVIRTSTYYGQGTFDAGTSSWSWQFATLPATDAYAYREPVIGTDGVNIYLACLQAARDSDGRFTHDGSLRIFTVDPGDISLTPYPPPPASGAWEVLRFKWLRGGKAPVDPTTHWTLLGLKGSGTDEASGGGAVYASEFNLPPVPSLTPMAAELQRGVPLVLDASATQDPDLDILTYMWSHTHPDVGHVHLTPIDNGRRATLVVDKAIGPNATTFSVVVSVKDPSHGAVTAASVISVPANPAPVITPMDQRVIPRNAPYTLEASVSDADACTYLWEQIAGTPVGIMLGSTLFPVIQAYRMDVTGEDLGFRLTVDDGVNPPVTAEVTLRVAPMAPGDLDIGLVAQAYYLAPWYVSVRFPLPGNPPEFDTICTSLISTGYATTDRDISASVTVPNAPTGAAVTYSWDLDSNASWYWAPDPLMAPSGDACAITNTDYGTGILRVSATVDGVTKTAVIPLNYMGS